MKRTVTTLLEGLLVLAIVAIALGAVLGQPVLVGYVETGSMTPTLDAGDGFVAVPSALAGDVSPGSVVVFRATHLHGGGLTTHRIVDETPEGYITQGDANPSTDQAGSEPPVKDAQIVAEVLQVDGRVVVVPRLGAVVLDAREVVDVVHGWTLARVGFDVVQTIAILGLLIAVVGFALDARSARDGRRDPRATGGARSARDRGIDARLVVLAFTGLVVLGATAAMIVPSGPVEYGFVSSNHDVPGAGVIGIGDTESTTHVIQNAGIVPIWVVLETDGDGIDATPGDIHVAGRGSANATVTLTAPHETGYYRQYVVEHRYLAVLPEWALHALYDVHPWLPIVTIDLAIGVPFAAIAAALVGPGRIRTRSTSEPLGLSPSRHSNERR